VQTLRSRLAALLHEPWRLGAPCIRAWRRSCRHRRTATPC